MLIKENESLSHYTTFKMGGTAKKLYFPESIDELKEFCEKKPDALKYIIGGGSNLLINDKKDFEEVLCLRNFNMSFENKGDGIFYIGGSVRLQTAIRELNKNGYGGIEYLFSVPGLIGGAIYMNAGRGKSYNQCISDYIQNVDVLVNGKVETIDKNQCDFSYRHSGFQNKPGCIILGALFKFPEMSKEESSKNIDDRIELCKRVQDNSNPNFGTVFCESNKVIMALVKKIKVGSEDGCRFSGKTTNWMLHGKNGSFEEAVSNINKVKKWHKLLGRKCKEEVRIWE